MGHMEADQKDYLNPAYCKILEALENGGTLRAEGWVQPIIELKEKNGTKSQFISSVFTNLLFKGWVERMPKMAAWGNYFTISSKGLEGLRKLKTID